MRMTRLAGVGTARSTAPIFEGDVEVADVLGSLGSEAVRGLLVTFRDGGRTVWHTHDADQILVIIAGRGVVESDGERLAIESGDIVMVPAGERHWHGSESGGEMTHLSFMASG
jgi:quercetin dioxygenase-like cupin family protein